LFIAVEKIDPSPFQHRRYFDETTLKEPGASILRDGLIEPIVVRPQKNGRFQLIAGERRLRAIKNYTNMTTTQAKIADVTDLEARRISTSENILRRDLSALETIEDTVGIIDVEMGKEPMYLTGGKTPLERLYKLLSKLDSIRVSKERGSLVSKEADDLFYKFIEQVESIFKNLPKPLKWLSFLLNDLILLTDIPQSVQKASVKHDLNKSQTRALATLEQASDKVFHEVTQNGVIPIQGQQNTLLPPLKLNEVSAREIQGYAHAQNLERTNTKKEQTKDNDPQEFSMQVKVALMTRLGIPHVRMARRLNIHRETIARYAQTNDKIFDKIHEAFKTGVSIPDISQKYCIPQALVWSVVLNERTDQERFKALNWGLRTWDQWNFNDVDHRFGDPWPGRIPAQLVAHTLFYFTRKNDLVLEPMAFLNADFRDFQRTPAVDENPANAILVLAYTKLLEAGGWEVTHLLDCPLSTERFTGNMVSRMQEKRTLGIVRRTLIVAKPNDPSQG
jgi:ParB/Sulfiredoxin domain